MKRLLLGLAVAGVAVGGLYASTISQGRVECEACMLYAERTTCSRVAAPSRGEAEHRAVSHACSVLTTGVTRSLECQRTPPISLTCRE